MRTLSQVLEPLQGEQRTRGQFRQSAQTALQRSESARKSLTEQDAHQLAMLTLWERMGELFGAKFLRQFGNAGENAFETWSAFLADLSPEQVEGGFRNMLQARPRFVADAAEFREYCVSARAFGLPDAERAYLEAGQHSHDYRRHKFSHPAVLKALLETGIQLMREGAEKQSKPVFLRNYQILCRRVMAGESIDVSLPKALPERVGRLCTPEENRANMRKLLEMLA